MKQKERLALTRHLQQQGLLPPEWDDDTLDDLEDDQIELALSLAEAQEQNRQVWGKLALAAFGLFLGVSLFGGDD